MTISFNAAMCYIIFLISDGIVSANHVYQPFEFLSRKWQSCRPTAFDDSYETGYDRA
jgi:hypothetical protein